MKPIVAHLHRSYLAISETFIYQYLTCLRRYHPVMLARRTENLDNFPFDELYTVSQQSHLVQAWNYIMLKGFQRQPYFQQILHRLKPSLIHAHFGPEGVNGLHLRRALKIPLITSFYGNDISQLPMEAFWRAAYRRLFREADGFLILGNNMRRKVIELGCPEEKIHYCPIGIDTTRFLFKPRVKLQDEPFRLLMCGRLVEKKGVVYVIEALAKLGSASPAPQLRIVGDGPLRPELENLIRLKNLQRHVQILGYLPHQQYTKELEQAHIFLAPSVRAADGDSEGTPTVLLEAQAAGLPVLSTLHADIPEIIGVKDEGFLVPERDVEALAANLRMMMTNSHRWLEWGEIGRKHVEASYDIHKVIQVLESIYDFVIQQHHARK